MVKSLSSPKAVYRRGVCASPRRQHLIRVEPSCQCIRRTEQLRSLETAFCTVLRSLSNGPGEEREMKGKVEESWSVVVAVSNCVALTRPNYLFPRGTSSTLSNHPTGPCKSSQTSKQFFQYFCYNNWNIFCTLYKAPESTPRLTKYHHFPLISVRFSPLS